MAVVLMTNEDETDLKKGLDGATYCLHGPTFEATIILLRHLGETTLLTTAMDVRP